MRINEIITESAELEEGWKNKVGAAAIAGLGLLGAGHSGSADAQTYQQRPSVSAPQQAKKPVPKELSRYLVSGQEFGRQTFTGTSSLNSLAQQLGNIAPFAEKGMLTPEQARLYDKFKVLYLQARKYVTYNHIDKIFSGTYRYAITYAKNNNRSNMTSALNNLKREAEDYSKSVK